MISLRNDHSVSVWSQDRALVERHTAGFIPLVQTFYWKDYISADYRHSKCLSLRFFQQRSHLLSARPISGSKGTKILEEKKKIFETKIFIFSWFNNYVRVLILKLHFCTTCDVKQSLESGIALADKVTQHVDVFLVSCVIRGKSPNCVFHVFLIFDCLGWAGMWGIIKLFDPC